MAKQGRKGQSGQPAASIIMSSDTVCDLYCELCSEDGNYREAEGFCVDCQDYLCKDCYKGHRSSRACRSHVLQDKTQMPCQKHSSSVLMPSTETSTDKCALHLDRLVEYYCRDDRTLGCSVCITMSHRLCNSIDHIPDLAEQLVDSQEYKQFEDVLSSLKTKSQDLITSTQQNIVNTDKWLDDAVKTIKELRTKMNAAFDKYERELRTKAEAIHAMDANKMKDIATKGNTVFNEVEKISADLQSLQNKNQLCQLFIQMIKLGDNLDTLRTLLTEADGDHTVTAYTFEPSSQVQDILDDPASIGKLSVQSFAKPSVSSITKKTVLKKTPSVHSSADQTTTGTVANDPRKIKAVLVSGINVRTESGSAPSNSIMGSALLPDNKLLIIDIKNKKVKLLNLYKSKVTSELKTCAGPWDITTIAGDQVAVTLRDARMIVFVKVADELRQNREMTVDGGCTGILHNNSKLIVAFVEPRKIEIMALDGTVEHKIDGSNLFKSPSHIAVCVGNEIYVTDNEDHCVKQITLGGAVKSVYRDTELKHPRGITVDKHGRVLVCGGGSGNIHLLTPNLTKVKVLINGIHFPKSLSYCQKTGTFFVGSDNDSVKVYHLS